MRFKSNYAIHLGLSKSNKGITNVGFAKLFMLAEGNQANREFWCGCTS